MTILYVTEHNNVVSKSGFKIIVSKGMEVINRFCYHIDIQHIRISN